MSVGADKIIEHIKADAQLKSDEIISKATVDSDKILADGEVQALAERDSIIDAAHKQADMKYQQIISEAKVNSRRKELESREELIEKAFRIASDKIEKLASENAANYVEALKNMIIDAAVEIGSSQLEIFVRADDIDNVNNMIDEISETVSEQTGQKTSFIIGSPIAIIGGAVVSTIDGDIEVKNTIEARMLRYRKYLRSEVAKKLFR
ncbi:V-type proton ATPase subunit E [Methanosphaera cuniculi]|uniref:A-type ATP synthase subunit E n=1 Tax=Methanosphaera cuniculi TaxID=1077256 RepID=A0A2A2HC54_9EURY|nr:V-type proton ATPase subunit E [Methanosphaera cuniculi]PAV07002.1 ATP synthase subunit E [Methanosphaera cuniculi]PWL08560.1 V-type proton ATPase subunit E [Methanosphaera cuniculi]